MSLLGAGDIGGGGKQKVVPTLSRTNAFTTKSTPTPIKPVTPNPYAGVGPNFNGVGGMSGNTPTNVARAKTNATPISSPKPQPAGPVTQGVPTSVRKDAIAQIKKEGEGKHLAKGVVSAAAQTGNFVKDTAVEVAKSAGRLTQFAFSPLPGVDDPYATADGGTEFGKIGLDALNFLPYGKIAGGVAKGARGIVKGVSNVGERVFTPPITVNAAQVAETVTAAGRRPVRPGSRPPTKTGKKPPTINPGAGPMSRQLAEVAPKKPNSVTVKQGKTQEVVAAEEKAAADRQALLDSTAPSQELLDKYGAVEMTRGPEIKRGRYDYPTDSVSRAGIFHGTASPEPPVVRQGSQASQKNLLGGNFFTTDSADVAKSYSAGGTEKLNNVPSSTDRVYRVNGAEGKKMLDFNSHGKTVSDQDPEMFQEIYDEIKKINPEDAEKFLAMEGGAGNTRALSTGDGEVQRMDLFNIGSPYNEAFRKATQKRGYQGFTHDGGKLTGDVGHQVLGFWDTAGLTTRRSTAAERSAPSVDKLKGKQFQRKLDYTEEMKKRVEQAKMKPEDDNFD